MEKEKKKNAVAPEEGSGREGEMAAEAPNDPMNPLNAAYDMKAYELLRKLRLDEEHQMSQVPKGCEGQLISIALVLNVGGLPFDLFCSFGLYICFTYIFSISFHVNLPLRSREMAMDEPDWDHLPYLRRSPSPCRLRTTGAMWPTRKGGWRSRAGGVYLPPELRRSPSASPARWMYPEEFKRKTLRLEGFREEANEMSLRKGIKMVEKRHHIRASMHHFVSKRDLRGSHMISYEVFMWLGLGSVSQEGAPVALLRALRALGQLQQLGVAAEEIGELVPRESAISHLPA